MKPGTILLMLQAGGQIDLTILLQKNMASSSIHTQKPQSALLSTWAGSGLALEQDHHDSTAHSSYQPSMMHDLESPTSPTPCLSSASPPRRNDATRQIYLNQDEEEPPPTSTLTSVSYYPSNKISTSKYTLITFIPKNLYEQFRYLLRSFTII